MRNTNQRLARLVSALVIGLTSSAAMADADAIAKGKDLAFNRTKGNCLGCHQIQGGTLAGNIAPPLVAMHARYPDKAKLRAQIYDATAANPHSIMPPFGKHGALSDKEIDLITEYVHSL